MSSNPIRSQVQTRKTTTARNIPMWQGAPLVMIASWSPIQIPARAALAQFFALSPRSRVRVESGSRGVGLQLCERQGDHT